MTARRLALAGLLLLPVAVAQPAEAHRKHAKRAVRRAPSHLDLQRRIAWCESGTRYELDHPGRSSASGAYGYLDGTWAGYGGYGRAKDAPAEMQDERAAADLARVGTRPWRASRGCWG